MSGIDELMAMMSSDEESGDEGEENQTGKDDSQLDSFYTAKGDMTTRADMTGNSFMSAVSHLEEDEDDEEDATPNTSHRSTLTQEEIQAKLDALEAEKQNLMAMARQTIGLSTGSDRKKKTSLVDLDFGGKLNKSNPNPSTSSVQRTLGSDSEDDEMMDHRKDLSESGKILKKALEKRSSPPREKFHQMGRSQIQKPTKIQKESVLTGVSDAAKATNSPTIFDDYFKIKIRNPKISSSTFDIFCDGLKKHRISDIRVGSIPENDWVTVGVIVERSEVKKSSNGNDFMIWKLHDLRNCQDASLKVLLFGECVKQHWKIQKGTVLALMSPQNAPATQDSKDKGATVKLSKPAQVVELGISTEFGICKGVKNDGIKCGNFVNTSLSDYCIFHVMNEARKLSSKRGAFSSTSSQPPAKRKDAGLFVMPRHQLNHSLPSAGIPLNLSGTIRPVASNGLKPSTLKPTTKLEEKETLAKIITERKNDLGARNLQRLQTISQPSSSDSKTAQRHSSMADFITQHEEEVKKEEIHRGPTLGFGMRADGRIDLATGGRKGAGAEGARQRAIAILQKKKDAGKDGENARQRGKRPCEQSESTAKRSKLGSINSTDLENLLKKRSKHDSEANKEEGDQAQKYLDVMEKKEKVESFVTGCMVIKDVKVVSCKKCNYTAQKRSDLCLREGHLVAWHTAEKRFFKCGGCGKRTTAFGMLPTKPCETCDGKDWKRVAMKDERKVKLENENLQLRGEERLYVNK